MIDGQGKMKLFSKKIREDKVIYSFLGVKYARKIKNLFPKTKIYSPYHISNTKIGKGTYISENSSISFAKIGKYCSIGPNFICGWGIHPLNGISTSPCFYSTRKQNGMTFSNIDKIAERKLINIGNDVLIGMNVCILDGINIGNGAIIGAGAIVTQDVPPYAVVGGVPARIIKYRFSQDIIDKLQKIQWWEWNDDKLQNVEKMFFDVEEFVNKYGENNG